MLKSLEIMIQSSVDVIQQIYTDKKDLKKIRIKLF